MSTQKKITICDAGVSNLRLAIINQAKKDYIRAVKVKYKNEMERLERFFRSQWCLQLTGGIDGDKIIESLQIQAKYQLWRDEHKCGKCKIERCIHKSGSHYTTLEKGKLICEKQSRKEK